MNPESSQHEAEKKFLTGRTVYIIGPFVFCNEVLATTIESRTGARCQCIRNFKDIEEAVSNEDQSSLILWDCLGKSLDDFMNDFIGSVEKIIETKLIALLNVRPGLGIEESCVSHGIRGIFYEDDVLNLVLKGILAIHKGELWFSREVMTKYILEDKDEETVSMKVRKILTQREIEIISLLAVGCKNEEIADKLCVSPHTIKTHLYNIYKKINVTNRLQATLWAAKNL